MDMTRIEKVIEGMRQMNLEQFLVTDPMAVYYLTGQYYACGERMMVLRLDVEKDPVLVIGKLFPQDEEKLGIKVVYFDDTDDCVQQGVGAACALAQQGREKGVQHISQQRHRQHQTDVGQRGTKDALAEVPCALFA